MIDYMENELFGGNEIIIMNESILWELCGKKLASANEYAMSNR